MRSRGSALLLTMVILAVLTLVGVASLQLAQGDSITVNRQQNYRTLVACAEAAEKKLWAEYAVLGPRLQTVTPLVVQGTTNAAGNGLTLSIAHYDSDSAGPAVSITFDDQAMKKLASSAMSGGIGDVDQTNTFRDDFLGQPYMVTAHCRDQAGRQYEIEVAVRFGL